MKTYVGLDVSLDETLIYTDARHAKAALSMRINKTDRNDAAGLAQVVRTGWYREAHVKSGSSHLAKALLASRALLVGMLALLPSTRSRLPAGRKRARLPAALREVWYQPGPGAPADAAGVGELRFLVQTKDDRGISASRRRLPGG